MNITNKTLRACAREMGMKLNFQNKREVVLFSDAIIFNSRRRSPAAKRAFWNSVLRKRGCNARSIWNTASNGHGRRVGKLVRTMQEAQDPRALFHLSDKLRNIKCYELANMSHDLATRLVRKQKKIS
jgi:hypothetical protein